MECPFCHPRPDVVFHEGELVLGLWDGFPVCEGHALVVTRRHVDSWFDATVAERAEIAEATQVAREAIRLRFRVDAFNLGVNVGEAAGQTVHHLHLHVIPRRPGDVPDPRGGVRHVLPATANYLCDAITANASPSLLSTGEDRPLYPLLAADLAHSTQLDIAVAFAMTSGVEYLYDHLQELLRRKGRLRLVAGDYLDITDPDALQRLLDLAMLHPEASVELRVFESRNKSFHPKAYIVSGGRDGGVAYVGSSNLSLSALGEGVEWNYRVLTQRDQTGFEQVASAFERLFAHPSAKVLDEGWLAAYRARRRPPKADSVTDVLAEPSEPPPEPNDAQQQALTALETTRREGYTAGLVVMATGLGKTWLAAFDTDRPEFKRVLFVAHREEILAQAARTFRRARPSASFGFYDGSARQVDADIVFGSIQTLGKSVHLNGFRSDHFDYVVVDEFHHAAAATYRRLIDHFRPRFLLGLTATPERTDGGNLLALCQENLVYRCDLPEGIAHGLLSPFEYYGVPDDVDYQNIPWRSARFDEEALTTAVATQARAQNALEQWQRRESGRTLAFCVSQRHADFMREFFRARGVRAAAVHSGETSDHRVQSMEQLAAGGLEIVFAVDIFNEGVDVPAIETVVMLRPTESQVLWLQQLGRGLRWVEGKRLKVIDYIGNHRTFLVKIRALLQLQGAGDAEIASALAKVQRGDWDLPPGCAVTYDLRTIEILSGLLRHPRATNALQTFYLDYRERLGVRPTAVEAFHENYLPRTFHATHGSWLEFVDSMHDLTEGQRQALAATRQELRELEKTQMTKSYKMLVVSALLDAGALVGPGLYVDELVRRVRETAQRNPRLLADLGNAGDGDDALRKMLERNPIDAWVGGKGTSGIRLFAYDGDHFRGLFEVDASLQGPLSELVREIVDWRIAEYLARNGAPLTNGSFAMSVSHSAGGRPILFLDRKTFPHVPPEGEHLIRANGERYVAKFVKIAINVIKRNRDGENELPSLLRGWFGAEAGAPGTRHEVVAERDSDGEWILKPVGTSDRPRLTTWTSYSREQIPLLFGDRFTDAVWNAGFIVRPDTSAPSSVFLLVTLDKEQMLEDHRYADRFLAPDRFEWQSQNRTKQASLHGALLRDHATKNVPVHLFLRPRKKLAGQTAAPFVYCGEVQFESWRGDAPITVVWRLNDPVPRRLWEFLGVPG